MKVKKQRGKDHWTVPYCYAGRRGEVHIWKNSETEYMIYCGADARYRETFEDAVELAKWFTHGGAL